MENEYLFKGNSNLSNLTRQSVRFTRKIEEKSIEHFSIAPFEYSGVQDAQGQRKRWCADLQKARDETIDMLWKFGPITNMESTEFANQRSPFVDDDDAASVATELEDFDASKHHPAFFSDGKVMHKGVQNLDANVLDDFDSAKIHPSIIGHAFLGKPAKSPPPSLPPPPCKDTCSPREYLEHYIFPVLLPALDAMLHAAKQEKCFERKRTKFNAADFLTEYLYRNNPNKTDREGVELAEIPFVKEHWKEHPRPPLPMSLVWSEAEGSLIIQSFWRGFKVRREPDVQELRQWQREWREENEDVKGKVSDFWAKKMGDEEKPADESSKSKTDEEKPITEDSNPEQETRPKSSNSDKSASIKSDS